MTAGDLIYDPYQYEFRNLLFGSQTSFITQKVTGLLGMPSIKDADIDKTGQHGAFPGVLAMNKRVIAFDLAIVGVPGLDIEEKLALAARTFQTPRIRHSRDLEPFFFWRPGQVKKMLWVRCTKRDFTSDYDTALGLAKGSVELVAPDPVILSATTKTRSVILAPGVTNGTVVTTNEGDFVDGAYPVVQIDGPWTNPRILNQDDDARTLRFDVALGAGDSLRLTGGRMKAEVRRGVGGAWGDGWQYVRSDNQFWNVLPGVNTITFTRDGGNAGANANASVTWQDAYA